MRVAIVGLLLAGCGATAHRDTRETMEAPPMVETAPAAAPVAGYDDYRFGMTPDEVRRVPTCRPYQVIAQTDLECPNLQVDGQKRNVSFHFDAGGRLAKIQLWFAERVALDDGVQAVMDMNDHFGRRFGSTQPANSRELITNVLRPMQSQRYGFVAQPQGDIPPGAVVWGEVQSVPGMGFFVMVYYQDPGFGPAPR